MSTHTHEFTDSPTYGLVCACGVARPNGVKPGESLPPKPGHTLTLSAPLGMSTLTVNRLIEETTNAVLTAQYPNLRATANRHRHPAIHGKPARYAHGFGTDLRDTLVASFTASSGEVVVHYPPNYWGPDHPTTDDWLRARVAIWNKMIFALGMTPPDGAGFGIVHAG